MKASRFFRVTLLVWVLSICVALADKEGSSGGSELLSAALQRLSVLLEPPTNSKPQTLSAHWSIVKADGAPKGLTNAEGEIAFQSPDRARISGKLGKDEIALGRDQQQLWAYVPGKKFGVIGKPGVARFLTAPEKLDTTVVPPFKLPLPREQLALLPFLCEVQVLADEKVGDTFCRVIAATPKPEAVQAFKLPAGTLTLWLRESDALPVSFGWTQKDAVNVRLQFTEVKLEDPWSGDRWALTSKEGDKIETTAVSHLTRAIPTLFSALTTQIPTLGPATGQRRLMATEGKGRLEIIDGTRLVYLEGTPEEMGRQHGTLLKKSIRDLTERVLYGIGVGSSFEKGRWFFGEIEEAQRRINPFIDPRYLREMDALAVATKLDREEVRLANFFPELFHCSGFSLFGDATQGGRMYHGRILDYLRGVGLEPNAVVMVFKPDQGNAWVNVSYAGFVGSVTAMNEKKVSIGEMGGRGEGSWDGKPMAQLVREVMEKANTLEEAVELMRKGPRTCEYYYVISDGKTKRAVGIAATASTFEVITPGESHPRLPHAMKDVVLMSAGDRYEALAKRVKENYGKIDEAGARDLMTRPVCMNSNIHSVLFEPETLDFWVANADSKNVASHTRYTHYNLGEILKSASGATTPR